jgi:hypothetical protein
MHLPIITIVCGDGEVWNLTHEMWEEAHMQKIMMYYLVAILNKFMITQALKGWFK